MSAPASASIHASAVMVGDEAVLIRGASGSGKSRLAFDLILAGRTGQIPLTVLIGDDRVLLGQRSGRLRVHPAPELTGLIEVRGLGIRRCDYTGNAPVGLVVDLGATDAARLPDAEACITVINGVELPRIPVAAGFSALPLVIAALTTADSNKTKQEHKDCRQGIGNHITPTIANP